MEYMLGFYRGLGLGALLSLPIWALLLWAVLNAA